MKKNTHTQTNNKRTNKRSSFLPDTCNTAMKVSDILNTFVMNALIFLLIIDTYFHENKKVLVFLCLLLSRIYVTTCR